MGAAYVLIGEAFLSSEGMDYEQGYLLLLVYAVLVFFFRSPWLIRRTASCITVAGKTRRRSVYFFILCISLMTKIEIEGKCCHGHSNHELQVNAVIMIQIIKHVDALFLRDIHDTNK
jgi:hypothetical protein